MLNTKSLGTEKKIPLNLDMEYTPTSFSASEETIYSDVSSNFCMYNKYECILAGIVTTKNKHIDSGETLLTLPVKPKFSPYYFSGSYIPVSGNPTERTFTLTSDGRITINSTFDCAQGDRFSLSLVFPISTGGGLLNRVISFLRSHRLGVLGC